MNKRIAMTLLSVLVGYSTIANCEEWPSGSAMYSGSLAVHEKVYFQEKSDNILEKIYTKIPEEYQEDVIKKQVQALRNYADSACLIVGMSSGAGGSWPSTYSVRCEAGIAFQHYKSLKNSLKCIERVEEQSYIFPGEKLNCVIQSLNTKFF